jgi:hypothetical protein
MKTGLIALIAIVALRVTASAAPQVAVDTVITDYDSLKKPKILARVRRMTQSGKPVTIRTAVPAQNSTIQYRVTPTFRRNGTVDYSRTFIQHFTTPESRTSKHAPLNSNERLGKTTHVAIGSLFYSTRTTIAK